MTALSDHQSRRRQQRLNQAKEHLALARRYVSNRPFATGSDLIRTLTETVAGLLEEISIGDLKND